MLLDKYKMTLKRAECNTSFTSVHCIVELEEDISEAIPYLNVELEGSFCSEDPPSVLFMVSGKLVAVHPKMIAINALDDMADAEKVFNWVKTEILEVWSKRDEIEPSYEVPKKPQVLEIFKTLPGTNCGECGVPTCLAFAARIRADEIPRSACPYS